LGGGAFEGVEETEEGILGFESEEEKGEEEVTPHEEGWELAASLWRNLQLPPKAHSPLWKLGHTFCLLLFGVGGLVTEWRKLHLSPKGHLPFCKWEQRLWLGVEGAKGLGGLVTEWRKLHLSP
jgi:hypothetical protein